MHRVLALFALAGFASTTAFAQDPAKVAPKQCKVAFENQYVRVLHWTIGPHEKVSMHGHPALVSISLSGSKSRYTSPDGKTREVGGNAGQAVWNDPEKHASENLSDTTGEVIQVELKEKPGSAITTIAAAEDSVKVDPRHYAAEFENDRVRVLRIKYGPHEKSVMHAHPANVAVYLTDGRAKMTLPDGKTGETNLKAGQVKWADKEKHLPENVGTAPFELILVELR